MLAGLLGSSEVRPWPVRTAAGLASHMRASVNSTPLPSIFVQVRPMSAPLRYWCMSAMVQLPMKAFNRRPLCPKKCLPAPNGRSNVLMKLNTYGRSKGRYDFGCVRLYISCGYTWFCEKICRYVSNASDFDQTYEVWNCHPPKRRCTLMVPASYQVRPSPLFRDQTFRNCGKGRRAW